MEVPEPPKMLVVLREQVRPSDGLTERPRVTAPLKPFIGAIVILDVPVAPARTVILVGLAVIVKSITVKVTVAECERLPLVPVTVTV